MPLQSPGTANSVNETAVRKTWGRQVSTPQPQANIRGHAGKDGSCGVHLLVGKPQPLPTGAVNGEAGVTTVTESKAPFSERPW